MPHGLFMPPRAYFAHVAHRLKELVKAMRDKQAECPAGRSQRLFQFGDLRDVIAGHFECDGVAGD